MARKPSATPVRKPAGKVHAPPHVKTLRGERVNRREWELAAFRWWEANRPPGY